MNWDIQYLIQNSFITMCAVIALPAFLLANKQIPKTIKKYIYFLVLLLLAENVESYLDHVLGMVPDNRYGLLRIFVSAVGYCLRPLMIYVVLLLMERNSKVKNYKLLLFIPSFITIIVAGMAFFTDKVFIYDELNHFHDGPLRNVFFVCLIVYFILLLAVNVKNRKDDMKESILLFGIVMLMVIDMVVEVAVYEVSVHSHVMALCVIFYFMHFLAAYHQFEVDEINTSFSQTEKQMTKQMLDQSIETLAYTIDAKDRYTKGHSFRVAKYARQIAKLDGMSEEDCRKIYLSGLLHDIGKISIHDEIINKNGKLTEEEYAQIKKHTTIGSKILEKMSDFPFLKDGAHYHHERYDGKGYPEGLKGDEIPEQARIIAVADAYDAMTSHRSYRKTMDQAVAKQEIWKGMGTQFDPRYAKLMISLIDADLKYDMREKKEYKDEIVFDDESEDVVWEANVPTEITADNQVMMETMVTTLGAFAFRVTNWANPSKTVKVTDQDATIQFLSTTNKDALYLWYAPTVLVFSSDDGVVAGENYDELGVFVSAGYGWRVGAAIRESTKAIKKEAFLDYDQWIAMNKKGMEYTVSATRYGSLVNVKVENELMILEAELIMPKHYDKDIYIAVTGEKCSISNLEIG